MRRPLALLLLAIAPAANAGGDLSLLAECKASHAAFQAFIGELADPTRPAPAGWEPLPQLNPFMHEFRLPAAITVFGHDSDRIAVGADGLLAVLDLDDPRPLARQLQLDIAIDTPGKFLAGTEVRSEDVSSADGTALIDSAVFTLSTVGTHPGKTLAGCSYSLDAVDEAPPPAAPAATNG